MIHCFGGALSSFVSVRFLLPLFVLRFPLHSVPLAAFHRPFPFPFSPHSLRFTVHSLLSSLCSSPPPSSTLLRPFFTPLPSLRHTVRFPVVPSSCICSAESIRDEIFPLARFHRPGEYLARFTSPRSKLDSIGGSESLSRGIRNETRNRGRVTRVAIDRSENPPVTSSGPLASGLEVSETC